MPGLAEYRRKRRFKETPEPRGKKARKDEKIFVIQKHAARRLHYDLRLEVDGVLKSWAVPKGPSLNPGDKRLAIQVEDHPFDYRTFEGTIPEGNYGAGEVIVWDEGTFEPEGTLSSAEQIERGELKFRLHGKKLNGSFKVAVRWPRKGSFPTKKRYLFTEPLCRNAVVHGRNALVKPGALKGADYGRNADCLYE